MRIAKFEHACFVVEDDGQSLIVDPGEYTTDLVVPDNTIAVVITHSHADHLDTAHLESIKQKNPDVIIVGHEEVLQDLDGFKTQSVVANEGLKLGNFELEFFGGDHAVIASSIPVIANLGVMINSKIYYPGDSFTTPERPVNILALPVSAPWMKMSEAVEFVHTIKPRLMFPTHDAILSDNGKGLPDRLIPLLTKDTGATYQRLHEPLEI